MNGWESLYSTATGDYSSGNFKDSYNNYLKTASALLYKLNYEVAFANKDTVKTKPHNTAYLFTQLRSCVQRLEDILQNRATNGNLSSPQPSYISDLIITVNPTPQHLPLIPFSPLTRNSMHYAHQLATANQTVSITKQKSLDNNSKDYLSTNTLRKLDEDIRQYRTKLDQVNNQIQSIAEVTLLHWNADEVSKQLTIIDGELYTKVDFKKDLTLKDKRASKAQACMDFHRYLTNSFTHQFMIYADTTRSSANPPRPRENIIVHTIRIAYYLLNVHRNFNSFAALMKALTSPEVRRIRRLWVNLPTHTNKYFKEFSSYIKKEDNDYKAYTEILSQKIESFHDIDKAMVVIPWMQPHYEEIKAITQSYTSGKSGDNTGVILSAPGQRELASIFSLLEQCRSNDDDEWRSNNFNGRKVSSPISHKILIDGTSTNLPLDLSCMGIGNMELHHWLVSRIYLTKQQLIDESMEIEPLGENEQPLCVENEYEEEEEEESDHNSVGRYEISSEDGADNIEAGTSSNYEVTNGSRSQYNQPSPNKLGEHNNSSLFVPSKTSLMSKHERSESGSKSIVNGTSSISEEPVEVIENDSVGTNSLIKTSNVANSTVETTAISSFTSSSKTKAIPIPQSAGQKSHQPSISPASMLTNLNPNAQPFVPKNLSSSAPGPASGNNMNVFIKDLTEMGEKNKIINHTTTNTEEEEDDAFVYPVGKSDKEEDDDQFIYPQTSTEATSRSNGLKDDPEEDDDNSEDSNKEEKFTYPDEKNSQDDNDDGEGSSFVYPASDNTSSDYNNNININKNGMNGVIKVDKSSENENVINVKVI